jgi:hypothetical protein
MLDGNTFGNIGTELRKNILVAGILPASLLIDGEGRHAGQCLSGC